MKPQNKHLAAIGLIFTIHKDKYKILKAYDWKAGQVHRWVIQPMKGGRNFLKEANELDKVLRRHKEENQHIFYDATM